VVFASGARHGGYKTYHVCKLEKKDDKATAQTTTTESDTIAEYTDEKYELSLNVLERLQSLLIYNKMN
jgi:hypothetical protein